VSAALPTLLAIACSSSSSSPATGGDASADGASSSGASSGTSGASSGTSGTSSGSSGTSSGSSGTSGTSGASGTSGDSGADAAPFCPTTTKPDFAHCIEADAGTGGPAFVDYGATDAVVTMVTGDYTSGTPSYYDPPCIKIKAGQQVSWSGIFATHPLRPAPCNTTTGDQIPSISAPATRTTQSLKMTTPGTYGFTCMVHGTAGMNGVIVVY